MGVATITISTAGDATVLGTAATQFASSGAGTGFTAQTLTWGVDTVTVTAVGSGYEGALTATFSAGAATATAAYTDPAMVNVLLLAEVFRAFIANAGSPGEVKRGVAVILRMIDRTTIGGSTFIASNIATRVAKVGFAKLGRIFRNG